MERCRVITSWPLDSGIGSGVARTAASIVEVLRADGAEPEFISPPYPSGGYLATCFRRVAFNFSVMRRIHNGSGPVVGFDFDGFALPPSPRYAVINQGVIGDIARFETGAVRQAALAMARLERRAAQRANAVFVPSRFAADTVMRLYGTSPSKIVVMPNGVFLDEWQASHAPTPRPEILCVARLYRRKGVDTLLRAMPAIRRAVPDALLRIAGDGLERGRLERLSVGLGLKDHVVFEGDVTSRQTMAALYARCALFCLPSRHETFGIAFLEAMAVGKPVVGLNATAVPELVRHGADGLLAEEADGPAGIADAVISLMKDGATRATMGRNAMDRARTRYNWTDTARPLLEWIGGR